MSKLTTRGCVPAFLLPLGCPTVATAQEVSPAATIVARPGGVLTRPRTVFPIARGTVRDHAMIWTKTGLHLYVLHAVDDGETWMKTVVPEAFRGNSALIPSRGLAITAVVVGSDKVAALQLVIFSP